MAQNNNTQCETCCEENDFLCVGIGCLDIVALGGIVNLPIRDWCIRIPAGTSLDNLAEARAAIAAILAFIEAITGAAVGAAAKDQQ